MRQTVRTRVGEFNARSVGRPGKVALRPACQRYGSVHFQACSCIQKTSTEYAGGRTESLYIYHAQYSKIKDSIIAAIIPQILRGWGTVGSPPFFIVGCERSGTTLLRIILGSHSRLSIGPETWYLNLLTDLLEIERPLTPHEVDRAIRTITEHYRWRDLNLDADEFRGDV